MCNTKFCVFTFVVFSVMYNVFYVVFPDKISYFNSFNQNSPSFKIFNKDYQRITTQGTSKISPKCVGRNTKEDTLWLREKSWCSNFILKNDPGISKFASKWSIDVKSGGFYYYNKQNIKMCLVVKEDSFAHIEKCPSSKNATQEYKLFEYKLQNGLFSLGKQGIYTYSCLSKFFCLINGITITLKNIFCFIKKF